MQPHHSFICRGLMYTCSSQSFSLELGGRSMTCSHSICTRRNVSQPMVAEMAAKGDPSSPPAPPSAPPPAAAVRFSFWAFTCSLYLSSCTSAHRQISANYRLDVASAPTSKEGWLLGSGLELEHLVGRTGHLLESDEGNAEPGDAEEAQKVLAAQPADPQAGLQGPADGAHEQPVAGVQELLQVLAQAHHQGPVEPPARLCHRLWARS